MMTICIHLMFVPAFFFLSHTTTTRMTPHSSSSMRPARTFRPFTKVVPVPLRVCILNFLGETQDEILTLLLISKGFYEDCQRLGIVWRSSPTIFIRPLLPDKEGSCGGCTLTLLKNLHHHLTKEDDTTNTNLQQYRRMVIHNVHQFTTINPWVRFVQGNTDPSVHTVEEYADESRFNGVISLNVSQPTSAGPNYDIFGEDSAGSLPYYLSRNALPNLEEINFSNTRFKCSILTHFFQSCRRLERITWNNINYRSSTNLGSF